MADFLDVLGQTAMETVRSDYYDKVTEIPAPPVSLKESILRGKRASIITEIKLVSPVLGTLRRNVGADIEKITIAMKKGGAAGISVLTEPRHFGGSLDILATVRNQVGLPLLMKDIIVSPAQIDAAAKMGANAILLIGALFTRGYCEYDLRTMISHAHKLGLEVLLEAHTNEEFQSAMRTDADLVGINNRDLGTLKVDLGVTQRILAEYGARERPVVSESGIRDPADVRFLRKCGADAFLVGSSVMMADRVREKVEELVTAL